AGIGIYLINLDRRPDRLGRLAARFSELGLDFTRIEAIDGAACPADEIDPHFLPKGPLGQLGQGDKACTLSHFRALEAFLATDAEAAVIFEDDVEIAADFPDIVADLHWIPPGHDLVKLDIYGTRGLTILLGPQIGRAGGRALHPLLSRHAGGAGYLVTRAGAERILAAAAAGPVPVPIDHLLFNANVSPLARALQPLQVHPGLVRQDRRALGSDIGLQRKASVPKGVAYWWRETVRGLYEIRRLPVQLWHLARGARLVTPRYEDGGGKTR
ncbi:MAG: glycosyltransferase family 25 protein, partial [Rubricella sp.]